MDFVADLVYLNGHMRVNLFGLFQERAKVPEKATPEHRPRILLEVTVLCTFTLLQQKLTF